MSLATRAILFNTKNHMGRSAGILVAWITLSIVTLTAVTLWQRRGHVRAHRALMDGNGNVEEGTGAHEVPMSEKREEMRDRESVSEEEEATEEVRRV